MKILLANIGNRNITFQNQPYFTTVGDTKKVSFRDWTKQLLEDYENIKNQLDINIINPLVKGKSRALVIYLFYSDQTEYDPEKTNKDTIFEAKLMKKILIDKYDYKEGDINVKHVEAKMIDNAALTRYYRKAILSIRRKHSDATFVVCDAGGTAQQKMALKIMAEFMFDTHQFEVKYLEDNKLISDVDLDEYRSIINTEQAIKLLHNGNYTAASELLDYSGIDSFHKGKDWKKKIFAHTYFRFYAYTHLAKANANSLGNINNIHLKNYKNKIPDFDLNDLDKIIEKGKIIKLTDYLHKAEFLYNIKQYSQSVLAFAQFYEFFFDNYLEKLFGKATIKKVLSGENTALTIFENKVKELCQEELKTCENRYNGFKIMPTSLAIKCMIAKKSGNKIISGIAKTLSPHIDFTDDGFDKNGYINKLRNKIAHSGLFLTEANLKKKGSAFFYQDLLQNTLKIFNFKNGNPFIELNDIIEKNLRQ